MTVGFSNLVKARQKLGYTQREMAAYLGYTYSRYAMWEIGKRQPPLKEAIRVAKALGETVEILFDTEQQEYQREMETTWEPFDS
jgi:transcriptional regulator with XRE-family HTH domain